MKVETVLMVDGKQVEKVFQKDTITVYKHDIDDTAVILFFVNNEKQKVIFQQEIFADCGQNVGFIDKIIFTGVN